MPTNCHTTINGANEYYPALNDSGVLVWNRATKSEPSPPGVVVRLPPGSPAPGLGMLADVDVTVDDTSHGVGSALGASLAEAGFSRSERKAAINAVRRLPDPAAGAASVLHGISSGYSLEVSVRSAKDQQRLLTAIATFKAAGKAGGMKHPAHRLLSGEHGGNGVNDTSKMATLVLANDTSLWVFAAETESDAVARAAVLAAGGVMSDKLLLDLLHSRSCPRLRAAVIFELSGRNLPQVREWAQQLLMDAPGSKDFKDIRMYEAAVSALAEADAIGIALNKNVPWQVRAAAVARLRDVGIAYDTLTTLASNNDHFIVRQAAIRLCPDISLLSNLADSPDVAVRQTALLRLRELGVPAPQETAGTPGTRRSPTRQSRVLAIDLDDTLADGITGEVLPADANAIRYFANRGQVVLTTTRAASYALDKLAHVIPAGEAWVICDGGETIIHYPSHTIICDGGTASPGLAPYMLTTPSGESAFDKGSTLSALSGYLGFDLADVAAIGDGRVDVPMFKQVAAHGGTCVTLADSQGFVLESDEVNAVFPARSSGGVGMAIRQTMQGEFSLPITKDLTYQQTIFSQLKVVAPETIATELANRGLGDVVGSTGGQVPYAGLASSPGHITWAFPADFPKDAPLPIPPADAQVRAVGIVRDHRAAALVCEVLVDGEWVTKTPGGKTPHITIHCAPGVAPVTSNELIVDGIGFTEFETPFIVPTRSVPPKGAHL